MNDYILSIDQGTTSSRAIIFDKSGASIGFAQQQLKQIYPQPGFVEQDPNDILASQLGVISEAIIRAGINYDNIKAIGITNQRETTIVWDKTTGKPIYNAIGWQCRRTNDFCKQLSANGYDKLIYKKTGLRLDAYFSASKIKWILENVDGAMEKALKGELLFGTVDTFLMWKLSGGKIFATDYTNASRTMLFNIHTLTWDNELLQLFGIPSSMLSTVYQSSHLFGYTSPNVAGATIPICGVAGDQQAALFGQLCTNVGNLKTTYGTGCFMLVNTGKKAINSKNGLICTVCASLENERPSYALEGSIFIAGAAVTWLQDEMHLISSPEESEILASKKDYCKDLYVVPAFTGLGAPYWDGKAKGLITGITRETTRDDIVRATLQGIGFSVADIVLAMEDDLGTSITGMKVDGGVVKNNFLMQFQADILNTNIIRPTTVEITALGVAYLAGLKSGYWKDLAQIKENISLDKTFNPKLDNTSRENLLFGWKEAVSLTMKH